MTETGDALQVAVKGSEISLSILEKVITSGLRELEHMGHNSIAPGPPEKASGEPMAAVTIDNADVKEFASELKAQGVDFQILKNQRENENIFVFKAKDYATMQRAFENYLYKIHPEIERTPEKENPTTEQAQAQNNDERISDKWEHQKAQGFDVEYSEHHKMAAPEPKNASILDKLQPKSNAPENLKEQQAAFKKFLAEKKATVKEYNAALKLSKGPQQPDRGLDH